MQIRASSFKGERPSCSLNPNHQVHVHGSYDRYANCDDEEEEDIPRYLCVPCGRTISVLPDHFLPFRAVGVPLVEKYFDAQAHPGQTPEPPATQKEKGCLKRAWTRFKTACRSVKRNAGPDDSTRQAHRRTALETTPPQKQPGGHLAGVGQGFQHLFAPRLPLPGTLVRQRRLRRFIPESLRPARRPVRRRRRPTHRSNRRVWKPPIECAAYE